MNDSDNKVRQQIVDKIKSAVNILIAVSKDPTVDELSAALGLTALLNKLGKHATAVFSGSIPPAITFLDPDKVFEDKADSLRDFIIALDKEKADHLRYKVDGDLVKIFITPYRTTISGEDLEFSQGDYNIELVLALGVANQEHLDTALASQSQILLNVTVATLSAGEQSSQLGSMDWRNETASSLCEMVANLSDDLKSDTTLLDKQISTALLTGIVSATERFSNTHTSSKVMAVAAQLMAAGADQQLIAAKLQESHEINALPVSSISESVSSNDSVSEPSPIVEVLPEPIVEQSTLPPDSLKIVHNSDMVEEEPVSMEAPSTQAETVPLQSTTIPTTYSNGDLSQPTSSVRSGEAEEPLLGGILNATSDQAAEDARRELEDQQNKTILSHTYLGNADQNVGNPINSYVQPEDTKAVDIFSETPASPAPSLVGMPMPPPMPDFSTLPPPSSLPKLNVPYPTVKTIQPLKPLTDDPSQFKIPG